MRRKLAALAILLGFVVAPVGLALAAGFASIDATTPLGSDALNTADDQIRAFKTAVLAGIAIEHDNGQTTAADEGYHKFTLDTFANLPSVAARPAGHVQFVSDKADTILAYRSTGHAGAYAEVGLGELTKIDSSAAVGATSSSTVTIQAFSAAHREYAVSCYTNGVNTPTIVLGYDIAAGTNIYCAIQRVKGGNDQLLIHNGTANAETVYYRVRQVVG